MIMTTLALELVYLLRMVYGELAARYFDWLQPGILYADILVGILAGIYAVYLVAILVRRARGDGGPGMIRCTISFAAMLAFFLAVELMKGRFSFLEKYALTVTIAFSVYALFYVLMFVMTVVRCIREDKTEKAIRR